MYINKAEVVEQWILFITHLTFWSYKGIYLDQDGENTICCRSKSVDTLAIELINHHSNSFSTRFCGYFFEIRVIGFISKSWTEIIAVY